MHDIEEITTKKLIHIPTTILNNDFTATTDMETIGGNKTLAMY